MLLLNTIVLCFCDKSHATGIRKDVAVSVNKESMNKSSFKKMYFTGFSFSFYYPL